MSNLDQLSMHNSGENRQVTIGEEEITDVSLATFHLLDHESPATRLVSRRRAPGGGCGCGCAQGCGG